MDFKEFVSTYNVNLTVEDGVAIHKITPSMCKVGNMPITGIHSIIFVIEGELEIKFKNKKYLLKNNSYADIVGDQPDLIFLAASYNLNAYQLVFTHDYIMSVFKNKPPFSVNYVLNKKINPVSVIDAEYADPFIHCLYDLEKTFKNKNHLFRESIIKHKIRIFFAEIANYFEQIEKIMDDKNARVDQRRILFMKFLKLLTPSVKDQHKVDFYASELCVTPQYLGRVVREISGKTVYDWISQTLMNEIMRMLDDTNMPISQIADELSFSDQAVLCKFFKRYKEVSPLNYRNRNQFSTL